MMIIVYISIGIIGVLLILSPLFIWIHVSNMRKEMKYVTTALLRKLLVQANEVHTINENLAEMQRRQLKTMQYVCDRLDDILHESKGEDVSP